MLAAVAIYVLAYFLIVSMFIMQTDDFKSAGLTIEGLLGWVLGKQSTDFISYHFTRIALSYLIDYSFPLGFCFGLSFVGVNLLNSYLGLFLLFLCSLSFCYGFIRTCLVLLFLTESPINNFLRQVRIQSLHTFAPIVRTEINDPIRRHEFVTIDLFGNSKLILTPTWIILLHRREIYFAKQRASRIVVFDSNGIVGAQGVSRRFYSIRVIPSPGMKNFVFRLTHEDFVAKKDKFAGPVTFTNGVTLEDTRRAQFIQEFKKCVMENPTIRYEKPDDELEELCLACSVVKPNVLIRMQCESDSLSDDAEIRIHRIRREIAAITGIDENVLGYCSPCRCKPMWCLDCLATWFMHRVELQLQTTWLSSKATCPVCRSLFCVRDVLRMES